MEYPGNMREINIYRSTRKVIKVMLLCSVFVALGIFVIKVREETSAQVIGWLGVLFFGMSYPLGIYALLDKRPKIVINEVGIFVRKMHHSFINWEIIQNVYLATVDKNYFLCLVVDEKFEPSRLKGRWGRGMARVTKSLGFQELHFTLANVDVDPKRLAQFVLAMRAAQKPEREDIINKALPAFSGKG